MTKEPMDGFDHVGKAWASILFKVGDVFIVLGTMVGLVYLGLWLWSKMVG